MKTIEAQKARGNAALLDEGEQGFMLLGLIVAIAIILIFLGAAATKVAFSLHREREVESARRADQYVRAIRRFYLKNQHYPGSIEQLENTNNVRYLRKRYVDPLTGKADYRLILVGQNKTTVKGFFGQPLAGIASTGLGAVAGMQSSGVPGPTTSGGTAGGAGSAGAVGATTGIGQARRLARVEQREQAEQREQPDRRDRRVRRWGADCLARPVCPDRWGRLWEWAAARQAIPSSW
jgi:type II secretory pathway pseudopilin PulG